MSASSQISKALSLIEDVKDESLETVREMLKSAVIQVDEAMSDIKSNQDQFESKPERLREVEQRLAKIYEIVNLSLIHI